MGRRFSLEFPSLLLFLSPNMTNSLSAKRIAAVTIPIAIVALIWTYWWSSRVNADARSAMESGILADMLGRLPKSSDDVPKLADGNGDLVADAPTDPAQLADPETLVFSYIAEGEEADTARNEEESRQVWQELLASLATRMGKKTEYRHYFDSAEQMAAFQRGEVHVLGLNTGAVDGAVERGFVPLCALGKKDGTYGYTMKIIVPGSSAIGDIAGLRGRKVTFTRPNSNSGFKAAFVHLMESQGLLPERDYDWSFSLDHEKSIQAVVDNKTDAAAIASDVLARMIHSGQIEDSAVATIYESETFPPATIGYAYNLKPEVANAIRETFVEFEWPNTGVEREFGPMGAERFVAVNYKDDWANIRRIEKSIDNARTGLAGL